MAAAYDIAGLGIEDHIRNPQPKKSVLTEDMRMRTVDFSSYSLRSVCLRLFVAAIASVFICVEFSHFVAYCASWSVSILPLNQIKLENRIDGFYGTPEQELCPEEKFDFDQLQQRVELVREYLRHPKNIPREKLLVVGPPGALSASVGEIFGSSSEVFYLPNILRSISYYMKHEPTIGFPLATVLMENLFKCDFKEKELLVSNLMQNYTRQRSRALSRYPGCVAMGTSTLHNTPDNYCSRFFSDWLTSTCRKRSALTVVQSMLVNSVSALSVLMTDVKVRMFELKVVHVVRDPRAIIHGMMTSGAKNTWTSDTVRTNAYRLCVRMILNLKTGEHAPPWLKDRYKLVQIERLVSRPIERLRELYDFAGLEFNRNLQKTEQLTDILDTAGLNVDDVEEWRSDMSLMDVKIVERECKRVMYLLGYKNVTSVIELRDVKRSLFKGSHLV